MSGPDAGDSLARNTAPTSALRAHESRCRARARMLSKPNLRTPCCPGPSKSASSTNLARAAAIFALVRALSADFGAKLPATLLPAFGPLPGDSQSTSGVRPEELPAKSCPQSALTAWFRTSNPFSCACASPRTLQHVPHALHVLCSWPLFLQQHGSANEDLAMHQYSCFFRLSCSPYFLVSAACCDVVVGGVLVATGCIAQGCSGHGLY